MQTSGASKPVVTSGEIVTVEDEQRKNRLSWRLGRVEGVIKSTDDVIRGVRLRLANGQRIERPLQKVFPLEVYSDNAPRKQETSTDDLQPRQERRAARIANKRIQIINNIDQL